MPNLFDPFTLRGVTLKNRIGVSPMCQYWSEDGMASDWHLVHLGSRAIGGAGLIIAEATAVEPSGRITPQDAGLWNDAQIEPLARINRFIEKYDSVPGIQLAHAGRKASTDQPWKRTRDKPLTADQGGWMRVAPSAVPFRPGDVAPEELSFLAIRDIQQHFREAAKRALIAGYKWLEFHGAHGYLAHSFHSPLSNKRTDQYGGSFENRTRFTLETVKILRETWPDHLPLSVRLSVTDWVEGGWTTEESVELAKLLKKEGVDLLDCSSGYGVPGVKYPTAPGWQVPLSDAVRKGAEMPTAAVGMIADPAAADAIISAGKADIVLLATEMLRDPYWPFHAAVALKKAGAVHLPPPYDYVVQPHA